MSRLAAIGSESSRIRLTHAHDEIDFEEVPRVDRLERVIRRVTVYGVLIVAPDLGVGEVAPLSTVLEFPTLPLIFCGKLTPECAAYTPMRAPRCTKVHI